MITWDWSLRVGGIVFLRQSVCEGQKQEEHMLGE